MDKTSHGTFTNFTLIGKSNNFALEPFFRVILHSNMRTIHQNFTIDLRNFNNFQVPDSGDEEQLSEYGIQVSEAILIFILD